jgi:hypothetical protein
MGLPLSDGHLGKMGELAADRRHAQRLAGLPDDLLLQLAHAALAESSLS